MSVNLKCQAIVFLLVLVQMLFTKDSQAQDQTLGTLLNTSSAQNGYTLLAPSLSRTTYLVDNCGLLINSWQSQYRPGAVAYLLENGSLLRTGSVPGGFSGGGRGGIVEIYNWEGELIWSYHIADENHHQHHDVEALPNGNILVLAWEHISVAEAKMIGVERELSSLGLWPDKVMELKPIGNDSAELVWDWHIWDHLIQDKDSTLGTYGVISEHPELVDMNLNFGGGLTGSPDWNHCNALDYNPQLDQIIVNSRNFGEFWVIDHSTTIAESASHNGGNAGKGGDILYRWGNPRIYQRGDEEDQVFSGQHAAYWIEYGEDKGKIMVFNNGTNRGYSSIDVLDPPIDSNGDYVLENDKPYGPEKLFWTYDKFNGGIDFSVGRVSNAERLANGNTLITNGQTGYVWEVGENKQIVWEYQNPVGSQPLPQGTIATGNSIFRTYKYPEFYPAFQNRDLTPDEPIELNPFGNPCIIFTTATNDENLELSTKVFPNPVQEFLYLNTNYSQRSILEIYNINGVKAAEFNLTAFDNRVDVSTLDSGFYILNIKTEKNQTISAEKIIKL
ncbi:aryl-sulfate sulfotransferase [bacterium]|nr:aryl-sulfate sulfotransferase [bacterium]